MSLQVTIHNNRPQVTVDNASQLNDLLYAASSEARIRNLLGSVVIEADNGNTMSIVVGGEETVVSFDFDKDGPYYVSRGASSEDEPIMTCYLGFQHHTEFARKNVIPFTDGLNAVTEFLGSRVLPKCIKWDEA